MSVPITTVTDGMFNPDETKGVYINSTHTVLMKFDPATGEPNPTPNDPAQWRAMNGSTAFMYNPYTGKLRDARDVGSDVFGHLIVPLISG
jgi:hypothetical protein